MKKMFLFISIILLVFGFSANSNVVNSSNKNKNESNIEQTSLTKEVDPLFNIVYNENNDTVPKGIVTPTTASVDYIYGNDYDIRHDTGSDLGIEWKANVSSSTTPSIRVIGSKTYDDIKNEDSKESSDYNYYYEGTIGIEDLSYKEDENVKYRDSYLHTIYNIPNYGNYVLDTDKYSFSAPILNEKAQTEDVIIEEISTSIDSATVKFSFTPSTKDYIYWDDKGWMQDEIGKDIPVVKVNWVTKSDEILGTITGDELTYVEGKYSGAITINNYLGEDFSPAQMVESTNLVIYDEFGEYEGYRYSNDKNNPYLYESAPFDFTIKDEPNIPTKVNNHEITLDETGYTTATMNYEIDPGTDEVGNPLEVSNIIWENEDDNMADDFFSKSEKPDNINEETGVVSGTMCTDQIEPGKTYNTQLRIEFEPIDGVNQSSWKETNNSFITNDKIQEGNISVTEEPSEKDGTLNKESATVKYNIEPYIINGEEQEPDSIAWTSKWTNESGKVIDGQLVKDDSPPTSGKNTLEAKNLIPGTEYSDNKLTIVYDHTEYNTEYSIEFNPFTTISDAYEGDVSTSNEEGAAGPVDAIVTGEETAEIGYTIKPIRDSNGTVIMPSKITWVYYDDEKDKEVELGGKNNASDIDPALNGELEAENLTPGTTYNDTYLVVSTLGQDDYKSNEGYYEDGQTKTTISPFTTDSGKAAGIVTSDESATVSTNEEKTATIGYEITEAEDDHGEKINPTKIIWVTDEWNQADEDDSNVLACNDTPEEIKTNELEAKNLIAGKTYSGTYLVVFDKNTTGETYDSSDNKIDDFMYSSKKQGKVTSEQNIQHVENSKNMTVDYKIKPALNDSGSSNKITKIQWMESNGKHELGSGANISGKDVPLPGDDGFVNGHIEANFDEEVTCNETYLLVTDDENGIYEKCVINNFTNKDLSRQGTVEGDIIEFPNNNNPTYATVEYTIIEGTLSSGHPNDATKITWYGIVEGEKTKIASKENPVANEEDFGDGLNEVGILEAENLTPGTKYKDTYLVVEQMVGEPYSSAVMNPDISTPPADEAGIISVVGEPIAKGDSATITYAITPAKDEHGDNIKTNNVKWIARVKDPDSAGSTKDILLAEEPPDSFDGGTLTAYNLPTNITYEETYLVMEGDFVTPNPDDDSNRYYESTGSIKLDTGNFKTKKMIIGGSALGIVVIIFAIISFFAWGWIRRRKVN